MDLRKFLMDLRNEGILKFVDEELSINYEIPYVITRFDKGPALEFTNVREFKEVHVVGNVVNTRDKVYRALNVRSDIEFYRKLLWAEDVAPSYKPSETNNAVYEPLPNVDLTRMPIPRYFELEPGPCLTSAVVVGMDVRDGILNASIHRLTPIGPDKFVIRLVPRHLYRIYVRNREIGKDTPISISWGLHPAILVAAASSPPFGVFELNMANALLDGSLKVKVLDNGVPAPVYAEVVMEGYISARETAREGPCMDVLGTYDEVREQPIVRITRVYIRRDNPLIAQALVAGYSEHKLLMGIEKEAKIWQFVSNVVPEVKAVRLTDGGCGWLHAVVAIRKQSDGDPKNAIMAAFAAHPSLKHVIIVDDDINIDDPSEVEWAIATRFRADEDLVLIKYARGSTLDPVAIDPVQGITTKVGIDATRPLNSDASRFRKGVIPASIDLSKIKFR
ncbi:UbiD family decarboxylase [Vulcanisaeta distributa]|uniref:Anhydromevalonate phosphate decarboxylase n=1 Tax=Vulcanisaeta distributa (strain DSM 14429 / JCM 11212 / NBRC 100878 / IC-017) TaxID=572478 RepID=E1QR40_VULDI|nr:UbiD family decarboxylase [Vulcanisaeta distributa]ADN51730.1 UbiD family decarboxylase [Vulcanisaeta distributa DSM 14429]